MDFFELMYNGTAIVIGCFLAVKGMQTFIDLLEREIQHLCKKC